MTTAILGISAYYHDSAAALVVDGRIVAAAQEERFSRKKHDARFPADAIAYCLEEAGLALADVSHIVFYDKPLLKFERLLETYLSYTPRGFRSFIAAIPVWLKEKLFLKQTLRKELALLGGIGEKDLPVLMFTRGVLLKLLGTSNAVKALNNFLECRSLNTELRIAPLSFSSIAS